MTIPQEEPSPHRTILRGASKLNCCAHGQCATFMVRMMLSLIYCQRITA
jgi:hypothetical protein